MKKLFSVFFIALFIATLFPVSGECKVKDNLYNRTLHNKEIKLFVSDVTDSTKEKKASVADIKAEICSALSMRGSANLKIAKAANEADMIVECDVTENIWTADDPMDSPSAAGMIMDAMRDASYARIQATFIVKDAKTGNVLWSEPLKATLTKEEMSEKDSVPLISARLAKVFVINCFGRSKSSPHSK
ncbi:MAG TPA: hypothetical protein PKY78_07520 [Candidatus Omnitrophota bacterium]|nr:hypothetical protein [Candidatus Omnitrophota bacterium]